jgi:polyferredoxin
VLIYTVLLSLFAAGFVAALATRTPLKVDVIRDRGSMGRELDEGRIENVYRLQVMNTAEKPHRFSISVGGLDGIAVDGEAQASIEGAATRAIAVRVQAPRGDLDSGSHPIQFTVSALDDPSLRVVEDAVFIIPR